MATKFFNRLIGLQNDDEEKEEAEAENNKAENDQELSAGAKPSSWTATDEEGQLSVDVYQTENTLVIKSTIAGVKPEDLDIAINNDMVTIKGERRQEKDIKESDFFYQECYWGGFSRSIILPMEIIADEAEATLKNGVLTITLPKAKKSQSVAIKIKTD